ncbi:MAG TPA: tetratricopeptide repeat protein [Blastocatellia bacterium]|nr:tetratricopeptide repeat protein [Blastocatellia bacterium]
MRLLLCLMTLTFMMGAKIENLMFAQAAAQEGNKRAAARSVNSEAERLRQMGTAESLRKAIVKYEDALLLWRSAGDKSGEAETLTSAAQVYNSLGDKQRALDYFQRAIELWKETPDVKGHAIALSGAGAVQYALGSHRQALDYLKQSLLLFRSLKDAGGEAKRLNDIGAIYFALGEPQEALKYYQQALPTLRAAGERAGEASALNNIGAAFRVMGEPQEALAYYKQALSAQRDVGDSREMAITLSNIGALHYRLGDAQQALDYYDQALPLRRKVGAVAGQAITLAHIGAAHLMLGNPQRAMVHLKQALSLTQGGQSRPEEAQALTILAAASSALGNKRQALEYLHRAFTLYRAIGERQGESNALIRMGRIYREQGDPRLALKYLEQALQLAREVGETGSEAVALADIARVEHDLGDLDQALNRIETALNLVETLRARIRVEDLRVSFLASRHGDYEFYIDLLMRLHERQPSAGYDALAFEASERARGRNLLDVLCATRADIRQGVDPISLERQRSLQRQINAKEWLRMRLAGGKQMEKSAEIEKELRALLAEYQDAKGQTLIRSPRYAALTDPAPLKLKEIQLQSIDQDTLLLEYSLGEERSFLWAVTPSSLRAYTLPRRAKIEAAALRAYGLLTKSNKRQYTGSSELAAAQLSRMILGPVVAEFGRKRLVIVSDGVLQYLPFGALPDPATAGAGAPKRRPLIVDHEVVNLPSASVLATMRREMSERRRAARTVAVFSDPVFNPEDPRVKQARPGAEKANCDESKTESDLVRSAKETGLISFGRLIHTRKEAEAIIALARPEEGFKALDFAASRATVINAGLDQFRIVHFATHGLLNSRRPELSGIVLSLVDEAGRAQEGFLRAHEIFNLKLNAELVVLSACSTALGKEIKGEGMAGLTRGFMYAGTPRVIASLWNVRDDATAELMKRFYQNMLIGKSSPAAALQEAQVSMWREPQWAAPYYWAGFTLQGEWR